MAPLEIPGYFYDPVKKKYFKIERSGTAPSNAAWSADSVKRRRVDEAEAAEAVRRQRRDLSHGRVTPAGILQRPLTGGFLRRELGGLMSSSLPSAAFAEGLTPGIVRVLNVDGTSTRTKAHQMCIAPGPEDDCCTIYTASSVDNIVYRTIMPQEAATGSSPGRELAGSWWQPRTERTWYVGEVSDLQHHSPSGRVLITSGDLRRTPTFWSAVPPPNDRTPPSAAHHLRVVDAPGQARRPHFATSALAVAPVGSGLVCAVGSSSGVLTWDGERESAWLTPHGKQLQQVQEQQQHQGRGKISGNIFADVCAVDFRSGDAHTVLMGGRPGGLWAADVRARASPHQWAAPLTCPGPVSRLRSVNLHQVLVAGLRNHLALYDLRFERKGDVSHHGGGGGSSRGTRRHATLPVLSFAGYRNDAHFGLGFDYHAHDDGGGVVAAANDDGTVALYSVRDGLRLRAPALDGTMPRPAPTEDRDPVRALRFHAYPGDAHPTLFVGERNRIRAYAVGKDDEA